MSSDIDLTTDTVDLWSDEYRTDEYMRWAIESLRAEYGDPEQPMAMYQVEGTDPRSSLGRAIELERFSKQPPPGPQKRKAPRVRDSSGAVL